MAPEPEPEPELEPFGTNYELKFGFAACLFSLLIKTDRITIVACEKRLDR